MLLLLSSSSLVKASEDVASDTEIDIALLEFLGDTAGLENLGIDLDELLGLDDASDNAQSQGGVSREN